MSDAIALAKGIFHDMDCKKTGLNNNILVLGGPGSGKTYSHTEPILAHVSETNLIVTVTKERIMHQYAGILKERGYNIYQLNLARPEKSTCSFDPMGYITCLEDVDHLATAIVEANPKKKRTTHADPYWDSQATTLCKALLLLALTTDPQKPLAAFVKYTSVLAVTGQSYDDEIFYTLDDLFDEIQRADPSHPALPHWKTFKNIRAPKTAGIVQGVLSEAVGTMFSRGIVESSTIREQIDLERFASEKSILFIVTSPVNRSQQYYTTLFYAQAFKTLFEFAENLPAGRLPYDVHMVADDFASGAKVPDFEEYISIFREKGISVSLLCQSQSQIEAMYGQQEATTIINCCDTILYMGGMDVMTCREVSMRVNRPLEDVLYLPVGRLFLMQRGRKPVCTERYPILEDPIRQMAEKGVVYEQCKKTRQTIR